MKYFPLVWAGLWRKKARTILTLLSIAVAFILFGVLQGVNAGFGAAAAKAHLDRLVSGNMGFGPLPIATLQQIEAISGVTRVSYIGHPLFGSYQQATNRLFGYPVDLERYLDVYPEIQLSQQHRQALLETPAGAVIGAQLAEKFGLKIGDRLPVTATILRTDNTTDWTLDIVGIFTLPDQRGMENGFLFNYAYYDEMRVKDKGTVAQYQARISDPAQAAAISGTIDDMSENSAFQTRTMSERENAESQLASLGDISYIVNAMVAAAFFTLLFLTGNTMMQSVRERVGEFAVLKTLGFSNVAVTGIVVAEAVVLCAVGAAVGLAIAAVLYPVVSANLPGVGYLAGSVVIAGVIAAIIVALVSSLPPALRVNRLQIIDALSGR
jgi:putative ABC transport system permease protein